MVTQRGTVSDNYRSARAGLILTAPAPPRQTAQPPLVAPQVGGKKHPFNIMQSWGHLSPLYSVDSHGLPKTNSLEPQGCKIKGLHWLQRHGARYAEEFTKGNQCISLTFLCLTDTLLQIQLRVCRLLAALSTACVDSACSAGPMGLAIRLQNSNWTASGDLSFLNDWSYKLGGEILTPFGRQQLCS